MTAVPSLPVLVQFFILCKVINVSSKLRLISITSFSILSLCAGILWCSDNGKVVVAINAKSNHDVMVDDVKRSLITKTELESDFQNELTKNININTDKTILNDFLIFWMQKQPKVVMDYILTIDDKKFQFSVLVLAMTIWHDEVPSALEHWLLTVESSDVIDNAIVGLCHVDSVDLAISLRYAEKISNIEQQDRTILMQLKKWVEVDVDATILWALKSNDNYQRFGVGIFQELIRNDFEIALFSLSLLSNGDLTTSRKVMDLFVTKAYQDINDQGADIDAISMAILLLPHSDFSEMVLLSLAPIVLEQNDMYSSMKFLDQLPTGTIQNALQHQLVSLLVERDVIAALDYVALMDESKNRQQILNTMTIQWAKNDLSAASEWLGSSNIMSTDIILPLVQIAINQKNTDIATEWLNKMESTEETAEFEFKIAKLMYEEDPYSARKYLQEASQLSLENQTLLLEYIASNKKQKI